MSSNGNVARIAYNDYYPAYASMDGSAEPQQLGATMSETALGVARESFGERSITTTGETHTSALVAAAQAAVQARYVVAMQRPRNWDDVRVRLLKECERPGFAEVARYNKPIGQGVKGPSIRFAEACFRYAGNLDAAITTTFEDRHKRILHVNVVDFESNASHGADITIEKTVERRDKADRIPVAERKNSKGETVYIVEATEDELLNKVNALVSKAVRTLVLRLIPGDIVDEAQRACQTTLSNRAAKDPGTEKKRVCDAFAEIGVFPADLALFLGHSLDAVQPAELVELREIYATVRDGEASWKAVLEARRGPKEASGAKTSTADLEAKLKAVKGKGEPAHDPGTGEVHAPSETRQVAAEKPKDRPSAPTGICVVCKKKTGADVVPTHGGGRHPSCSPLGLGEADAEPPANVVTVGREPGQEG
jgi:hypothetical protein